MPGTVPGVPKEMFTAGWESGLGWSGCLWELPELGDQETPEKGAGGAAGESCTGERFAPGWDSAHAQAGENAEGGIEAADSGAAASGTEATGFGNFEFRNDPERTGREMRAQAQGESVGFVRGKAVEEEVGGDQVVGFC